MNTKLLLIAFLSLFTFNKSFCQISISQLEFDTKKSPNIIYYNFYNGIQMIEIDYNNLEKARVDFEDGIRPINSIRPRNYGHNTIILRNKNGEILHQYNLRTTPFKPSDFIAVDKTMLTLTHFAKINSKYEAKSNYPSYGKYNYYVTENNKAGVLDTIGNPVLEVVYDAIQSYSQDYKLNYYKVLGFTNNDTEIKFSYTFQSNGKWGFKNDKITIEPKYEELIPIKKNVFRIKKSNNYGLLNFKEKVQLNAIYEDLIYKNDFYLYSETAKNGSYDKKYGIINSKFKTITKPIYSNIDDIIENYKPSGKYWAYKTDGFGAIDKEGNEITMFKYGMIPQNPYQKFYRTNDYNDSNRNYILDLNFKEIGSNFEKIYDWNENLFIVIKDSKMGLLDLNNNEILPCEYQSISQDFKNNLSVVIKNDAYGVINSSGKIIIPCKYHFLVLDYSNTIYVQIKDENIAFGNKIKSGVIDRVGKIVIPILYDSLESIGYGLWKVKIKDKYGIVTIENKEITPVKYDEIYSLENGFCIAKIDFGYGYINKLGQEITHFYYQKPANFKYNSENKLTAKAFLGGKEVTIDDNGKVIKQL
ncbi:WG repeat-containing protein [Flavobacterium sp.]|uniref:WG repeat-containing protein n=1 Tax=Flavobacterium sp. TaxID=239 RepID=UPI0037537328